jgi:hypothetical protein
MGASGKKLRGHGQRTKTTSPPLQVKDGGYGRPPHPRLVRAGQVYWPRKADNRRRQFRVTQALADGTVHAQRTDGARESLVVTSARLLAVDKDGNGRHYSFIGWTPRRYQTWACAVQHVREQGQVVLVLPEWHPARPVRVPDRLLPFATGVLGGWMHAVADLAAPYPARLALGLIGLCEDPGRAVCPAPDWPTADGERRAKS